MNSKDPIPDDENRRQAPKEADPNEAEAVWTYRGYRLRPSEFTTAMVHFFRAEIQRANLWRTRLDTTTNWAVVATGASLTIAFAQSGFHGVILLNVLLVTIFLVIESRRYRYYELWSSRVRLMETDFYAAMLVPPFHPADDWAEALAESLLHPNFPISMLEALGRRLRRNYIYIYFILVIAWFTKISLFPSAATNWSDFTARASIGALSGIVVTIVVSIFISSLIILAISTVGLQQASGEVLPKFLLDIGIHVTSGSAKESTKRPWFRHSRRRRQLLALIITDRAKEVSTTIFRDMNRGVTSLHGTGMYTGKSHEVLLCAITITEVGHIKALVCEADPKAFLIVIPAQEVLGTGFIPLQTKNTLAS
jgi:uncharacterized membrane protein